MRERNLKTFLAILGVAVLVINFLFLKSIYDTNRMIDEHIRNNNLEEEEIPEVYITKIASGELSILPSVVVEGIPKVEEIMLEIYGDYTIAIEEKVNFKIPKKYYKKFSEKFDINSQNFLRHLEAPVTKFSVMEVYDIRELNIGDQKIKAFQKVVLETTWVRYTYS